MRLCVHGTDGGERRENGGDHRYDAPQKGLTSLRIIKKESQVVSFTDTSGVALEGNGGFQLSQKTLGSFPFQDREISEREIQKVSRTRGFKAFMEFSLSPTSSPPCFCPLHVIVATHWSHLTCKTTICLWWNRRWRPQRFWR